MRKVRYISKLGALTITYPVHFVNSLSFVPRDNYDDYILGNKSKFDLHPCLLECDYNFFQAFKFFLFWRYVTLYEFTKVNDLVTIVNTHHLNHQGLEVKGKVFFDKIQMVLGKLLFMEILNDMYAFLTFQFCKNALSKEHIQFSLFNLCVLNPT